MLVEVVENGGLVSFLHPLAMEEAIEFWERAMKEALKGDRLILGAFDGDRLVGTVTLLLTFSQNQPHRAEVGKMMTRVAYRGKGIARALMLEAERLARGKMRTLLVLNTAAEEGAAGLYEKLGFNVAGFIPNFMLKPHGGLTGTIIYWKEIGQAC
jgi:GNAT superfamily N-acetyltransferase